LSVELLKPLLEVVVEMVSFILVHLVSVVLLFLEILNTSSSIVANSEDGEVLVGVVLHLDLLDSDLELGVRLEVLGCNLEGVEDDVVIVALDGILAPARLLGHLVSLDLVRVLLLVLLLLELVNYSSDATQEDDKSHDHDEDATGLLLLVDDMLLLVGVGVGVTGVDLLLTLDYDLVVLGGLVLDNVDVGGEGLIRSGVALVGGGVGDLDGFVAWCRDDSVRNDGSATSLGVKDGST